VSEKDYPRPSVTVDPAVLTVVDGTLRVALWCRRYEPFAGQWALPGVFVDVGESLEAAVRRALTTKLGVAEVSYLEQLFTWDHPDRDPRGWVMVVAYFVLLPAAALTASTAPGVRLGEIVVPWEDEEGGAVEVWAESERLPLAFDHEAILGSVVKRLRGKLRYTPVALAFLPETFTLRQLQSVYEAILGRPVNKDSFRRHVGKTMGLVEPTGRRQTDVDHRPAELYRRAVRGSLL
jgi:8-oxo-dGTP diphosphatase